MTDPSLTLTDPQRAAFAKVACGADLAGSMAVLCGPPGVGKTLVLHQLAADDRLAASTAPGGAVADVAAWLACPDDLPPLVLADDAHRASDADLTRLLSRCRAQQPASALVLAGQGRLLTLIARDRRLTEATAIRVSLLPGTRTDTASLLGSPGIVAEGLAWEESAIDAVHEIAAGIPAAIKRLADLARVVAAARPDGGLRPGDIEAIHRRLSPHAA
jgi:hypothetical protein